MRLFSIFTAIVVVAALYGFIFERDRVFAALNEGEEAVQTESPATQETADSEVAAPGTEQKRKVSVAAKRIVAQSVQDGVLLRGQTEAARQVEVRAETSGLVVSEPLPKGSRIQAGQLLCEIDPGTRLSTLAETQARLAEARAQLPVASARVDEAKARLKEAEINDRVASSLSADGFASETRLASTVANVSAAQAAVQSAVSGVEAAMANVQSAEAHVATAQKDIDRLQISAPFGGLLETDTAELGTLLQPGAPCATIIQLDPIIIVGFVPETEVDRVQVGALAGARLVSGRDVTGQVTFLSRSADPQTRTFRVEIEVANADQSIRDGQTADIAISAEGTSAHLVPQSALTLDDHGTIGVRLVDENSMALFAPVQVLRDTVEGVWVAGLPEQANVITVGQEYVTDGVPVEASYEEMTQ